MRDVEVHVLPTAELVELARRQLAAWTEQARALLPDGGVRMDAHCHLGTDSDGSSIDTSSLLTQLDAAGIEHATAIALHRPEGYALENARVREWAAASGGRLHALHRCDPAAADPAADARAGLEAGACGLKWHPRAERFTMTDEVAVATAAVADEFGVPVLIHAGRGMERLGEGVVELARANPRATFLLAHAAISDLSWIVAATDSLPNVVFDTSWWRPTDVAVLLTQVPVGRVVHASDPPYGSACMGLQITTRIARACGWGDAAVRELMGETAARMFGVPGAGELDPALATAHLDQHHAPVEDPALRRAGEYLASAVQIEFAGGDATETFELAGCALQLPPGHRLADAAAGLHGTLEVGRELLARASAPGAGDPAEPAAAPMSAERRLGVELLICTLAHLATPELPVHTVERMSWVPAAL